MKLSLVLATFGRASELGRCLESLVKQSQSHCDFEILVMDQNPDDRLVAVIEPFVNTGATIRHERLPKPGLAEARNAGIQIASGKIIGFPDDDCWYEPGAVAAVCAAFEADVSVSGVVANWVEQTEGGGNDYGSEGGQLSLAAWRNFRDGAASSISLFLKRDLLLQLNGFDTRLGVGKWYGAAEEIDLVLRALATGAKIERATEARVHHAFVSARQSASQAKASAVRARARGTGAIYAKHRLALKTVIRGLVAPVLKPLARLQFGLQLQLGWETSMGRLEGMRRWQREEFGG